MKGISIILLALAALGFVLAVVVVLFTGPILNVTAEAFSRACTNIALLDIIVLLLIRKRE